MQSTSASSLLMMSLDVARHALAVHGHERIRRSLDAAAELRAGIKAEGRFVDLSERFLRSPAVVIVDPLRIAIDTRAGGIGGHAAAALFHEHRIHTEMATDSAVVTVIGAGAAPDIPRVLKALHALPDQGAANTPLVGLPDPGPGDDPAAGVLRPRRTGPRRSGRRPGVGRLMAAYPPGIPNVMPGEILTADVLNFLRCTAASPFGPRPRRRQPHFEQDPGTHRRA